MDHVLLAVYKAFCVLLYVFLTAVLLYNGLFQRWLGFSFGFFCVFLVGGYVFFGKLLLPDSLAPVVQRLPYFLFFFGLLGCFGFALVRQMTSSQTLGLVFGYFFVVAAGVFFFGDLIGVQLGIPTSGAVQQFITSFPYVALFLGIPMVIGYYMYWDMGIKAMTGACILFSFFLLLVIVVGNNYFGQSFGFFYELEAHARAWIEIGSVLLLILGVPTVIAYSLYNEYAFKETIGALLLFLIGAVGVMAIVHLTIGYRVLANALAHAG